ncbi:hypothetical protein BJ165DRAFT_1468815 [Panaeolus papilionaceus]|nr:hypothetical protein BJ165DRAFT_1468815 [Panaeolus papilionaceus]
MDCLNIAPHFNFLQILNNLPGMLSKAFRGVLEPGHYADSGTEPCQFRYMSPLESNIDLSHAA